MRHKKAFILIAAILALNWSVAALEFSTGVSLIGRTDAAASTTSAYPFFGMLEAGFTHEADGFGMIMDLSLSVERQYPAPFMGGFFGPATVEIDQAGITYASKGLSLAFGKLENRDVIDSPYALFVSGANHSALLAEIGYEDERFFYRDRWVGLNRNLASGFYTSETSSSRRILDDRGAVLKTFGLKMGRLRFGFQDAVIFTGDYFEVDFFAIPAPGIFVQYILTADGRPWSRNGNQNSIMGFFADYQGEGWSLYGQLLVDDFNMNRFLNPDSYQNPDKIAFSVGGAVETAYGRIGAHAAGATRFAFESIGGEYYSYTYYPGSAVTSAGSLVGIPIEDQMFGFVHGENCLALMGTWEARRWGMDLGANLEFTLSGEKSPTNPWHDGDWNGTQWLDDPVLEKKIVLGLTAARRLGVLDLGAGFRLGWVQNRLSLVMTSDANGDGNQEPVWRPSGVSGLVGEVRLTGRYSFQP